MALANRPPPKKTVVITLGMGGGDEDEMRYGDFDEADRFLSEHFGIRLHSTRCNQATKCPLRSKADGHTKAKIAITLGEANLLAIFAAAVGKLRLHP